jgi:hypothetical protein
MLLSLSPHPVTSPVIQNIRSLNNHQNQHKHGPSGKSQCPTIERRISVLARESDSSQGGSSVASTIQGRNSTPSSSLNNSRVADSTHWVTSTPSTTQRRSKLLQPPRQVQAVITHQHPAESQRQTQRVVLYPAPHLALLALPLLSAVLNTCLLPSLMQKPVRSLQIHCARKLPKGISNRGGGNCNRRRCLHLALWSPAVAASIDLVTPT